MFIKMDNKSIFSEMNASDFMQQLLQAEKKQNNSLKIYFQIAVVNILSFGFQPLSA